MSAASRLADGVLVINLDERTDRWQSFLDQAADQLRPLVPTRLSAVKGVALPGFGEKPFFHGRKRDKTWAGRAGCALSHRSAIEHASRNGWKRVLVLEDDIQLEPDFDDLLTSIEQALNTLQWDICYLGYADPIGPFMKRLQLPKHYQLCEIYGCNAAHAYIVNESAYSTLLAKLPTERTIWKWLTRNRAIDRWYARTLSKTLTVLAISTSIVTQRDGISDITGRSYENLHVIALPQPGSTALSYAIGRALRRSLFTLEGIYDAGRGWVKRHRGF